MARLCFLHDDAIGLLCAVALKAARPELGIAVVESGAVGSAYVIDPASLGALDALLPGGAALLRLASSPLPGLSIVRGNESIAIAGGELASISAQKLKSLLHQRAEQAGIDFIAGAASDDIAIASQGAFAGFVETPVQAAGSDYRLIFAGPPHGRIVPLDGGTAVLRSYGIDAKEAEQTQALLLDSLNLPASTATGSAASTPPTIEPQSFASLGAADASAAFDLAGFSAVVAQAQDFVAAWSDNAELAQANERFIKLQAERAAIHQHGARNLADWYRHTERYRHLPMAQFAYAMLSASQRVEHETLARLYPQFVQQLEAAIAGSAVPVPPMFAPFKLRGISLVNRVVVSPMCMYSASEGMPDDFHLVHLGSRAMGGAGLLFTEMTAVSQEGRITPGCAGIYTDAQAEAWQRIVEFVHRASPARIGLQLGHAGPKASTQLGWQRMDAPLKEGNWPIVAASNLPFGPDNQIPVPLDEAGMARIEQAYAHAARRAIGCGFDMLELHAAHGYLLSAFISPLTNRRSDQYGGSLDNRLRFPLRVFSAIRKVWPQDKPISVRISAHDWVAGGTTGDDAVKIAAAFKAAGADAISVSTGQTTRQAKPLYGRMYQVPFADAIRNEVGIATIAVGAITEADQVNSIIASGRADLCALARPHLADPHWTLHAAVDLGVKEQAWPKQYIAGRFQAERELGRKKVRA
jgi:2,4-dienoyl-CoA reductase-like NADH-dependent reductase (Old Yellow Enzyme family)